MKVPYIALVKILRGEDDRRFGLTWMKAERGLAIKEFELSKDGIEKAWQSCFKVKQTKGRVVTYPDGRILEAWIVKIPREFQTPKNFIDFCVERINEGEGKKLI